MGKIIPCNGNCFECIFSDCIGTPPEEYAVILKDRERRRIKAAKIKCKSRLSAILDRCKGAE